MMTLSDYANEEVPSAKLASLSSCLQEEALVSPIDMYRQSVKALLTFGTEEKLNGCDFLGRLLVLGVVSAAEGYCRGVLANSIELCPISQAVASEKTVNLGGLLWHGKAGFSRSAFEHASFSAKKDLTAAYRDYLGFKLDDAVFKTPLEEYENVCQLRHGIVHGDGILPGRNAVRLNVPRYNKPLRITIRYMHLQDLAAVVNTLVFTLNRELFKEMCKRWAIDWRKRVDWDPRCESVLFKKLWLMFHSVQGQNLRPNKGSLTRGRCLSEVRANFGL